MEFSGPDAIDKAIQAGLDIRPTEAMLGLYREAMDKEAQRKRSGVQIDAQPHRADGCQTFQPRRLECSLDPGWMGRSERRGDQIFLQLKIRR